MPKAMLSVFKTIFLAAKNMSKEGKQFTQEDKIGKLAEQYISQRKEQKPAEAHLKRLKEVMGSAGADNLYSLLNAIKVWAIRPEDIYQILEEMGVEEGGGTSVQQAAAGYAKLLEEIRELGSEVDAHETLIRSQQAN